MGTLQEIEDARQEMIQILLKEAQEHADKIEAIDEIRTKLLKHMAVSRMHYDGVVKQLDLLGHDTSGM